MKATYNIINVKLFRTEAKAADMIEQRLNINGTISVLSRRLGS